MYWCTELHWSCEQIERFEQNTLHAVPINMDWYSTCHSYSDLFGGSSFLESAKPWQTECQSWPAEAMHDLWSLRMASGWARTCFDPLFAFGAERSESCSQNCSGIQRVVVRCGKYLQYSIWELKRDKIATWLPLYIIRTVCLSREWCSCSVEWTPNNVIKPIQETSRIGTPDTSRGALQFSSCYLEPQNLPSRAQFDSR